MHFSMVQHKKTHWTD